MSKKCFSKSFNNVHRKNVEMCITSISLLACSRNTWAYSLTSFSLPFLAASIRTRRGTLVSKKESETWSITALRSWRRENEKGKIKLKKLCIKKTTTKKYKLLFDEMRYFGVIFPHMATRGQPGHSECVQNHDIDDKPVDEGPWSFSSFCQWLCSEHHFYLFSPPEM